MSVELLPTEASTVADGEVLEPAAVVEVGMELVPAVVKLPKGAAAVEVLEGAAVVEVLEGAAAVEVLEGAAEVLVAEAAVVVP